MVVCAMAAALPMAASLLLPDWLKTAMFPKKSELAISSAEFLADSILVRSA
ncbi:hypothetical protein D3C72_2003480 [compost metagenome]